MAIPLMEDDVEVIGKLGTMPGNENGLTTQQLKERFDLGAVRIKKFLNEVLIPQVNMTIDVQSLLNGILDTSLSLANKAAPAKTVGEKITSILQIANAALPKSGGYMTGTLNMNNKQLTGLPVPEYANDAVPKSYVDTVTVAATLTAAGWKGDTAPYTQTITVAGLTDKKTADIYPVYSGTLDEKLAMKEACGCLSYAESDGEEITFWCLEEKPEADISVTVEVGV